MPGVAIKQFLVCEDVRQEVGGKFSLIGLMPTQIQIQSDFPAYLQNLRFFYELDGLDTSDKELSIVVSLPDSEDNIAEFSLKLNPSTTPIANAVFTIGKFLIPKAGVYSIGTFIDGKIEYNHEIRIAGPEETS